MLKKRKSLMRIPLPHPETITVGGHTLPAREVIRLLDPFLTPERKARIAAVVAQRTYSIAPVVEGLYDMGNVSAVMRTAEGLGYQPFHIIETSEKFKRANRVSAGAEKWLDIYRWKSTPEAIDHLKTSGYRVLVTYLSPEATPIQEVDFTIPTALIFGNEHEGVSEEAVSLSDGACMIPISGFVQSFNISVAAAICLYQAREDRLRRQGFHGDLTPEEQEILMARFYLRSIQHPEKIIASLLSRTR